jgi:hypothetical protein
MDNEDIGYQSKNFDRQKTYTALNEISKIFTYYYPPKYFKAVKKIFQTINELYSGNFPGYEKCVSYRDIDNVCNVLLISARMVDGNNLSKRKMNPELVINLFLAALFHDTGSIRETNETEGADRIKTRIDRSISFLTKHLEEFHLTQADAGIISKLIKFTGDISSNELSTINKDEMEAGYMLGISYFISQVTGTYYLENLLFLFHEFGKTDTNPDNEFMILEKSLDFYEIVMGKITRSFGNLYDLLNVHFKKRSQMEREPYLETMNRNIKELKEKISGKDEDLFNKLKQIDFIRL